MSESLDKLKMAKNDKEKAFDILSEIGDNEGMTSKVTDAKRIIRVNKITDSHEKKRRRSTSSEEKENYKKIQIQNDNVIVPAVTPAKKVKELAAEELKLRKQQQMSYLKSFVNVSLKYSQFLEEKIHTSQPSGSRNTDKSNEKDREDIFERMKYFEGDLRPYQREGVTWLTVLFENSVNGILADEMGLGKTIQIIALFSHLYERKVAGPFLIVAPLSTLGNWEAEFQKFAPKIPVVRFQGTLEDRQQQAKSIVRSWLLDGQKVKPVVLCSYQVPLMEYHFLQRFTWQYLVVDEGHRIKNADSKLSRELRTLKCVNRTLLTGTPLHNDIKELWALFNFIMPELFKDINGFATLLELDDVKDTDRLLENEAKTKVITTIHQVLAPFMLRREKKFVLTDIVPKKEVIVYCSLTELQSYIYRAVLQRDLNSLSMGKYETEKERLGKSNEMRRCRLTKVDYTLPSMDWYHMKLNAFKPAYKTNNANFVPNNEKVPVDCPNCPYNLYVTMTNSMMMLKKIVNHPYLVWCPLDPNANNRELYVSEDLIKHSGKLLVLDALLKKLRAGGHKVLIFSTMVMFMDMIEEMLLLRDYKYTRLDGSRKYEVRNENIGQFMTDRDTWIFLISTRAGGLGLNLVAADTVIFMDRDWNPMVDLQAQDRCHRIGQNKPVMIYSLIAKGTVDELILSRGEIKKRLEKIILKEGKFKTLKKHFNDNELKELEDLLNNEEMKVTTKANGLMYTDEELDYILDRSELIQEMTAKSNTA